jgi:hypothetical protein
MAIKTIYKNKNHHKKYVVNKLVRVHEAFEKLLVV